MKDYQKTLTDKQNQTLKPLVDKTTRGDGERRPEARTDLGHRSRQRDLRRHGHHGRRDQRVEITCAASLALVACGMLAACAHGASDCAGTAPAGGRVGYVRMDDLVKKHPLLRTARAVRHQHPGAQLELAGAASARRRVRSWRPRKRACKRSSKPRPNAPTRCWRQRQELPGPRERGDRRRLARGRRARRRRASVRSNRRWRARRTRKPPAPAHRPQRDLDTYRKQLEAQDTAQLKAAQQSLEARADRTYRAKIDELNAKESALSLLEANADAAERLSLRTKLSSLALDEAARDDANKQLAALDRKEADVIGGHAQHRHADAGGAANPIAHPGPERHAHAGRPDPRAFGAALPRARSAVARASSGPPTVR